MTIESRRAECLRRKDTLADLMEEVRPYVGMSPERRDELIQQISRWVLQLFLDLGSRPCLATPDALPESSRRIWSRLMEEHRRAGSSH